MKKDLTELVFILDMSGSMESLTDDTIGGFNSILREQSEKDGEVLVSTYLFNDRSRLLHDRLPIADVAPMSRKDYRAAGCTALADTLGDAIRHIVDIHRYAREEDIPAHTLFVITTDGMENASSRYSSEQIGHMIRHEEEKYGWEFVFLAANIDAVETASRYGIGRERAVDYVSDPIGTGAVYRSINCAIGNVRRGRRLKESAEWREATDQDFHKRGK
ncbi:MAG: hypothetical protein K6C08_11360 [Oscillospiraceae bacterium]|nr:hypothetical protein [Oscillospiraceae bacterium]